MAMKRVPLWVLVLLGAAAAFSDVAIAEEETDSRCQVQMCADGVNSSNQCRSSVETGVSCNTRCNEKGCDGGSQVGESFGCGAANSFILCQCGACSSGGGSGSGGGGGGGGGWDWGGGCSDCLCDDWACDDNCWWNGYDGGECYLGDCWCHYSQND